MRIWKITLLCVLIFGCKDAEKKSFLQEINVMQHQLDSISNRIDNNNTDSTRMIIENIDRVLSEVKKNYFPDSINLQTADLLNDYKGISKGLSRNASNIRQAREAIPQVQEALNLLQQDINNGAGNRSEYKNYILFEKEKVEKIQSIMKTYFSQKKDQIDRFFEINVQVETFSKELAEKRLKEKEDV